MLLGVVGGVGGSVGFGFVNVVVGGVGYICGVGGVCGWCCVSVWFMMLLYCCFCRVMWLVWL